MSSRSILIEGYTPEEILALSPQQLKGFVFSGKPLVFKVGTAQILGEFSLQDNSLIIELAQIEGGGEGALPTIAALAEKYARHNNLEAVEWIVHAIHCANPNLKLRRILERRGFVIKDVPGVGQAYYFKRVLSFLDNSG
jgi:hypothetical protein